MLTRSPWHDVVECHETAGAHERRVVGEVLLHPLVGVVAVDEEEVYRLAVQEPLDLLRVRGSCELPITSSTR